MKILLLISTFIHRGEWKWIKKDFLKTFFFGELSVCNCCIIIMFNFSVSRNTGGFSFDHSFRMCSLLWSDYKPTFSLNASLFRIV